MASEIASLSLEIKSDQVKQANVALREMAPAATAAERAAEKWSTKTDAAARSSEVFSKRVQGTIKNLEFERQQLTRSAAERQRYAMLQRAGVTASSAEGQAISASIAALQAQRAAMSRNAEIAAGMTSKSSAAAGAISIMTRALGPLVAALSAAAVAQQIWAAGMRTADLDEQAEQIGINVEQLQAWRLVGAQAGVETEELDKMFVRLQKTMGSANEGNKDAIENFRKLGVNILDANGELRGAGDTMPEVARGLLAISSVTERNALAMEILGKSGTKANTMLKEFAAGADNAVEKAKGLGAIAAPETIKNWDELADKLKVAGVVAGTLMATLGASVAGAAAKELDSIAVSLGRITTALNNLPKDASIWDKMDALFGGRKGTGIPGLRLSTPAELAADERKALEAEIAKRQATGRGDTPGTRAMIAKLPAVQAAETSINRDAQIAAERDRLINDGLPAKSPSEGKRNPLPKAGGGSDPYKAAIESAKEYIATKKAETEAVGQTALAAAQLKHETALINKASNDNKVLTAQQTVELKALAGAMAEADVSLKTASFMDDFQTRAEEFIAAQTMEQEALFMSTRAADALRFSTEALNAARRAGIELTPDAVNAIRQSADAMAEAKAKTDELAQITNLGREVFKGFFSDMREGLMAGQSLWASFGNAAVNALNRIAEKLIEMAATKVFDAAFPGGGGGIFGSIFGSAGGGAASVLGDVFANALVLAEKGRVFDAGNVVPFKTGGVVGGPTFFPMANGRTGLMGEAGPEAVMPLRRGSDGRLGVAAAGGITAGSVHISISLDDDMLEAKIDNRSNANIVMASPRIIGSAVKQSDGRVTTNMNKAQAEGGGDYRVR